MGEVWKQYTAGDCSVVVCHVDSGTHWNANNWYNAGEYAGIPLVDDDGNGKLMDCRETARNRTAFKLARLASAVASQDCVEVGCHHTPWLTCAVERQHITATPCRVTSLSGCACCSSSVAGLP